jgi:hypothetical protein
LSSKVLYRIRIRVGSGFSDFADPDPDPMKFVDPDPGKKKKAIKKIVICKTFNIFTIKKIAKF